VADGNPIVWLSRLARRPVSLVQGSDLVLPLARVGGQNRGAGGALVGSTAPVLEAAEARLRAEVPGLEVAARIAPPFGFDPMGAQGDDVIAQLRESGARLCLLALGAPKQESFAARARALLPQWALRGSGRGWISSPVSSAARRAGCSVWRWNGCGGCSPAPRGLAPRYARCALVLPGQVAAALRQRRARR
jgi:N-acetylglucosaminyldiphosphoundecaprenol N-acetyl-beta-D-mannosaminyltransferase